MFITRNRFSFGPGPFMGLFLLVILIWRDGLGLLAHPRYESAMLNVISHGTQTDLPPVLIAHGLFGSGRNWGVIAKRLSSDRQVLAVDMRNHGASPWSEDHSYPALADDLAEVIAAHGGKMDVLGHSMGGKGAEPS